MYQLRQLIPISNINNWCWSMQLKINWQVTVAQCNSNCSRIGIFSVYIIGVRLSDCWQGCNHLQLCSLVLFHYQGLCPHCSPTLYSCWMYSQGSCYYDNLSTWSLNTVLWVWLLREQELMLHYLVRMTFGWHGMGPRFISHLRTFWCTESPYFTSKQYPDGVRSVGIQGPESADLRWRKLNAW